MRRMGRIWTWREEAAGAFWDEARTVLKRNGVIAVPTETFFGLAVNPFQEEASGPPLCPQRPGPGKAGAAAGGWTRDAQSGGSGGPGFGPAAYGKILARTPDHHFSQSAPSAPAAHRRHRDHRGAPTPPGAYLPPDCRLGVPHHRYQRQSRRWPAAASGRTKWPGSSAITWT